MQNNCNILNKQIFINYDLFSGKSNFYNKRFICPKNCGRSFKNKRNMKNHYKRECGFKFPCVICDKNFSIKANLRKHSFSSQMYPRVNCGSRGIAHFFVKKYVGLFLIFIF